MREFSGQSCYQTKFILDNLHENLYVSCFMKTHAEWPLPIDMQFNETKEDCTCQNLKWLTSIRVLSMAPTGFFVDLVMIYMHTIFHTHP